MTILVHFCLLLRGWIRYFVLFTADFLEVVSYDLYRETQGLKLQKGVNTITLVVIGITVNVSFFEPDYLKEIFPSFQSIGSIVGSLGTILPIAQPIITVFSSFTQDNLDDILQNVQPVNLASAIQELNERIEEFYEVQGFTSTEIVQLWDQFLELTLVSVNSGFTIDMSNEAISYRDMNELMNDELERLMMDFYNQIITVREDFIRLDELAEEIHILVFNLGANYDVHRNVSLDPIAMPYFLISLLDQVVYLNQGNSIEHHIPYVLENISHSITNQDILALLQEYGSRSRTQSRIPFNIFYYV